MGTPDRRKKKSSPPAAPAADAEVTVPDGHEVNIVAPGLAPGVTEHAGGTWVADLGIGSDELGDQVDAVLEEVESLAGGPRPQVILSTVAGQLAALFAPNNPPIIPLAGLLVWVIDVAALAGLRARRRSCSGSSGASISSARARGRCRRRCTCMGSRPRAGARWRSCSSTSARRCASPIPITAPCS
ncbi:Hypothetical protein A7982_05945 [Minicystis rosea]|nr:Hypothetical protein A7982_05945 [Minicystis rosea]